MFICWDCGGSGNKPHYSRIDGGRCYTCEGTGKTNRFTDGTREEYAKTLELKIQLQRLYKAVCSMQEELKVKGAEFGNKFLAGEEDVELGEEIKLLADQLQAVTQEFRAVQAKVSDITYVLH
jgi:seryl-tRNA synthetase